LYGGALVAERYAAVGRFIAANRAAVDPSEVGRDPLWVVQRLGTYTTRAAHIVSRGAFRRAESRVRRLT
jgi:hypothetical protein